MHVIPIGIDLENFPLVDASARRRAREALGVPKSAFVVGSFQKDGVGWGEGLEPKLVKGPDVLIAALRADQAGSVRSSSSCSRALRAATSVGELDRPRIPHRHVLANDRAELARAYHALDVYVVTSRQEGGPKAMLESMATGIPLVTTRVGQVPEIARDGVDALVVDVDDVDALADQVLRVRDDESTEERPRPLLGARRPSGTTTNDSIPPGQALLAGLRRTLPER